jgi:hypothetical protein
MHSHSKTGDATGQTSKMRDNSHRRDSREDLYDSQVQSQAGANKNRLEFCFTPKTNAVGKNKNPSCDLDRSLGQEVVGFEGCHDKSKRDPKFMSFEGSSFNYYSNRYRPFN